MSPLPGLDAAIAGRQLGYGLLDADLRVRRRLGALSDWLPAEGELACSAPLLLHMEDALRALPASGKELVLPSMRLPAGDGARVSLSILWDDASAAFVVLTTPDYGGDQTDRLLLSERREKMLLQQQAEAAAAQMRVADALYRDLVESAGDLVLRFDAQGCIIFANRRVAEFLREPQNAFPGRKVDALFPSRATENPWRLERYLDRPGGFELSATTLDGRSCCFAWDIRRSGGDGGGEFQAVGRDVTAAKRLEAEKDKAREEARAAALAAQRLAIAHDLHDTLARSIVTLILEMGVVAKTTTDPATQRSLKTLQAEARAGLAEAREAISRLRQAPRGDDPRRVIDEFGASFQRRGVEMLVDMSGADAAPERLAETLSRVLREALRNIELHAGARRVEIALKHEDDRIDLHVADDGVPIDPTHAPPDHFGLVGMRERAALVGATLAIESAPGQGTRLTLRAPLAAEPNEKR